MEYITNSEKETFDVAYNLASTIEGNKVICLNGELGAGKTVFVKGFCSYFDIDEIPGPKIQTEEELIGWIRKLDGTPYGKAYFDVYGDTFGRFLDKFAPMEDGEASKRAAECLLQEGSNKS